MFIAGRRNRTRGILVSGFRTKLNAESQPEESVPLFLKVECYAGYKPDERPLRFSFISTGDSGSESSAVRGKPTYQVAEVIDRWYGPDYECFRIRADDTIYTYFATTLARIAGASIPIVATILLPSRTHS